ncbi:putative glycosyltransferase, exosortase G system-associated, partial [Levilactobacillus brevis]
INFTIYHVNTDKGKARALNTAIYESIGIYVINIDSDGLLEKNAVKNMVLRFENDLSIAAMTGAILPKEELVQKVKGFGHRLLAKNEYYEYAQAFLSGRTIEASRDQLFTMSGAFSAFRREVLMETFLYDIDTIGEDTDMTFQIRTRLGKKVVICADAIFYVEPISGFSELYTQRQRWQRGELEVTENYMKQTASLKRFFKNFLVRRMMIDHTFTFPRMIWTFATVVLIAFGYSSLILLLSYLLIYALYVVVAVVNFVSVSILLQP